jgi:hypothetical protein
VDNTNGISTKPFAGKPSSATPKKDGVCTISTWIFKIAFMEGAIIWCINHLFASSPMSTTFNSPYSFAQESAEQVSF